MPTSESGSTVLHLEQLPAFDLPERPNRQIYHITEYLIRLAAKKLPRDDSSLVVPSIADLSLFFKCSHLEIYDALRQLRISGYDFQFSKFDQPLHIWRNEVKSVYSKRSNP